jgi:hypothetical protein
MKTITQSSLGAMTIAAIAATFLTYGFGLSFLQSTSVARWVTPDQVATVAKAAASAGSHTVALLK